VGAGRINYDLYVGNSDSLRDGQLDYNAVGFDETSPAAGFRVGISPKAVPGLVVGVHGLSEKIDSFSGTVPDGQVNGVQNGQIGVQVLGGYMFYESDKWELISEYYHFNNSDLYGSAGTNSSWAAFAQAGYLLADRWTGFVRYEKAALNQNDPYFALMNAANAGTTFYGSSYNRMTVGARYDLDPRTAIKFQVEQMIDDADAQNVVNWFRTQYAVRF